MRSRPPRGARQDPMWLRTNGAELGRDSCRVPLPWSDEPRRFFGPRGGSSRMAPQPERFRSLAREVEARDPGSMLSLYRELARLRKRLLNDAHRVEWIETGDRNLLAFRAGASRLRDEHG